METKSWRARVDLNRYMRFVALMRSVSAVESIACHSILPPTWHWLYTHETPPVASLRADGHPATLPAGVPDTYTQRLWAGSEIHFYAAARPDTHLDFRCEPEPVILKTGRSGPLAFAPLDISVHDGARCLLAERRLGVYRPPREPASWARDAPTPLEPTSFDSPVVSRYVSLDEVALFRYSALLGVNHRVHYDYPYATQVEGHPGLVVHGPLIAQMLTHHALALRPQCGVQAIRVQAVRPHYLHSPLRLNAVCDAFNHEIVAWADCPQGTTAMHAVIELD